MTARMVLTLALMPSLAVVSCSSSISSNQSTGHAGTGGHGGGAGTSANGVGGGGSGGGGSGGGGSGGGGSGGGGSGGGGSGGGGSGGGGSGGGGSGGGGSGGGGAPQPQIELDGLAYGNGTYVAVGADQTDNGIIYVSTDGLAWQVGASGLAPSVWGVAYGNARFVALGSGFRLDEQALVSNDGRTWTTTNLPSSQALDSHLAFGDGQFVAAGQASHFRSTDGVSWTPSGPAGLGNGVVFAAGRFVSWGRGDASVAVFANGTWSSVSASGSGFLDDLRVVGDRFVGITKLDCCLGEIPSAIRWGRVSSTDGITWTTELTGLTAKPLLPAFDDGSVCVAFSELFGVLPIGVASGDSCDTATVVDLGGQFNPFELLHAGGLFVATGQFGIITSSDGRAWTRRL